MRWLPAVLAWLSYLLFRSVRLVFQSLVYFKLSRERKQPAAPSWQGFADLISERPLFFHYLMVTGPRWNCHAAVGVLRNLQVTQTLEIDTATPTATCAAWTLVVYHQARGSRTVAHVGVAQAGKPFYLLNLEPGLYSLGMRYYEPDAQAAWPIVRIDGQEIPAAPLKDEWSRYQTILTQLSHRTSLWYQWLHYHAVVLAGDPRPFTESFAHRTLLPVGNPETRFQYGRVQRGQCLVTSIQPSVLDGRLVYLTVLNQASLPVWWTRITQAEFTSPPLPCDGIYLIRLHARDGKPPADEVIIDVKMTAAARS